MYIPLRNIADARVSSAALLLASLGHTKAAARIETAVNTVLAKGDYITPDLGGKSSTTEVIEAVMKQL